MSVHGSCAPGYEAVRAAFQRHVDAGIEDGAQVCAYVQGVKVVDLWTSQEDYGPNTLQNLFSSTKVLTSLVVAMLADRGHLDYDQKVSDLWPEYAQHGKGETTIAHVMRHEAGLAKFDRPIDASELTAEKIRAGSMSDIIAAQVPAQPPGEKREYHAVTRGWIANEIVRRADPQGRTIGEFLRDEVAIPLGIEEELCVGLPDALHSKVKDLEFFPLWWTWGQMVRPQCFGGGKVPISSGKLRALLVAGLPLLAAARGYRSMSGGKASMEVTVDDCPEDTGEGVFNSAEMRRCETPSANGHASARALAKVAATIAQGGALGNGPRLLSPEGVDAAHGSPNYKVAKWGIKTTFTNAGWNLFKEGRHDYVGWSGLGGSVVQWHREERIGFGYAMNLLEYVGNERAFVLQETVLQCAREVASKALDPESELTPLTVTP